jgi:hypothetical protein
LNERVYAACAARANRKCECGCGQSVPPGHCDHFFGRAKAEEVEATCWILHPTCDQRKTFNRPSAGYWLRVFINHCTRWGYAESKKRAEDKLAWLRAKGTSGEAA